MKSLAYQTDFFLPAFYTSKSEFKVNHRLDSAEIAQLMQAKWEMGLRGGIIVANPIPKEYEVDPIIIDKAIEIAIKEMNELPYNWE